MNSWKLESLRCNELQFFIFVFWCNFIIAFAESVERQCIDAYISLEVTLSNEQ